MASEEGEVSELQKKLSRRNLINDGEAQPEMKARSGNVYTDFLQ